MDHESTLAGGSAWGDTTARAYSMAETDNLYDARTPYIAPIPTRTGTQKWGALQAAQQKKLWELKDADEDLDEDWKSERPGSLDSYNTNADLDMEAGPRIAQTPPPPSKAHHDFAQERAHRVLEAKRRGT